MSQTDAHYKSEEIAAYYYIGCHFVIDWQQRSGYYSYYFLTPCFVSYVVYFTHSKSAQMKKAYFA